MGWIYNGWNIGGTIFTTDGIWGGFITDGILEGRLCNRTTGWNYGLDLYEWDIGGMTMTTGWNMGWIYNGWDFGGMIMTTGLDKGWIYNGWNIGETIMTTGWYIGGMTMMTDGTWGGFTTDGMFKG
jgi:hypothetical protein